MEVDEEAGHVVTTKTATIDLAKCKYCPLASIGDHINTMNMTLVLH